MKLGALHSSSLTPLARPGTTVNTTSVGGSAELPSDRVQLRGPQDGLAPQAATAATAATAGALIAPGALLTVEQVVQHLTSQGLEFRSTGWFSGFTPARAETLIAKQKLEYRADQGEWIRVQSPLQLAHLLASSDLVQQVPSSRAQGLSASAHHSGAAAAAAAVGGAVGPVIPPFTRHSAPFKLLVEPKRVGSLEFASGILRHVKNPVEFFEEFHARHGKSFMVELPTGQRFLFDHRHDTVHEALKVTDSSNPNVVKSWFKPELQGHGLSFLMGIDNVFLGKGEEWKKTHDVIKPHLHGTAINTSGATAQVGQIVERHIQAIKDQIRAKGGEAEIDFRTEMQRATLDVALQLLLGTTLNDEELGQLQQAFQKTMEWLPLETANPTDFSLSRLPGNSELRRSYQALQGLAERMIAQHRQQPPAGDSVVSSLLSAIDPSTGQPLSDERIRNEILTLLLAGHETTATLLSWSFAELSRKPELWQSLQQEVDEKLQGRFPDYKQLKALDTVDNTVDETLRLYSPAYFLVREAAEDTTLGPPDAVVHAPKGTQLIMSTYTLQRDKDIWGPDADRFRPERFDQGAPRAKMVPFGSGARVCMGQHLAKLEANLILTRFAQEFEIVGKPDAPLSIESDISVHPGDATVRLRLRSSGPTPEGPPEVVAGAGKCPFMANLQAAQPPVDLSGSSAASPPA